MGFLRRALATWVIAAVAAVWIGNAAAGRSEARALLESGRALERGGQVELALERYEQAIQNDPDYLQVYEHAIPLWVAKAQFERAIPALERLTLRHPDHAPGWYALAFAYRRTGRNRAAVMAYQVHMDLRPADPDPYYGLGMTHMAAGDKRAAQDAFARYLVLEDRPAREVFVGRARRELREMRGESVGAASPADLRRAAFATTLSTALLVPHRADSWQKLGEFLRRRWAELVSAGAPH